MKKNFKTHKVLKITGIVVLLLIIGAFVALKLTLNPLFSYNPADVPQITALPMKVSDIYAISYFRSESGHDYSVNSWDGESCRSMKHYFNTNLNTEANSNIPIRSKPSPGHPNIAIYAPFDGKIITDEPEHVPIGHQIHIASAKNSSYFVVLFHTDLLPSLHVGSKVRSGQQIGTIGPMDGIDVAYEAWLLPAKQVYMSIFDHITSQAFAPLAAMGYKPNNFVLTRAQADARGYKCNGEQFTNAPIQTSPTNMIPYNWVSLRPNPWTAYYNKLHNIGSYGGGPNQQQMGNIH
jgi:hypothetical protein